MEPKLNAELEGHARKTDGGCKDIRDEHAAEKSTQSADVLQRMMVNVSRRRRESLWNQP